MLKEGSDDNEATKHEFISHAQMRCDSNASVGYKVR